MDNVCFTGPRPIKLPWKYNEEDEACYKLKHNLEIKILEQINLKRTHFLTGMAMGIDIICAEIIIKLKKKFNIYLEAIIPCDNQYAGWSNDYIIRYNEILKNCDTITYTSHKYTKNCMLNRNIYMINHSDIVIAVWNGIKRSGTAHTINYAKKMNK